MAASEDRAIQFLLVLDFEATCSEDRSFKPQEIIEFPVVCVEAATGKIVWEVHSYVKPVVNPKLTPFCTQLTGITQAMVDAGVTFPEALRAVEAKLEEVGLWPRTAATPAWTFVTCGDWDLKIMLPCQLKVSKLARPSFYNDWINIKFAFQRHFRLANPPRGMTDMLGSLKIKLVGRHHSGIDDCRNIAAIVVALLKDNAKLKPTFNWKAT